MTHVPRPTVPGHRVASSSLQSLTSSRPGLRDLACWAWAGRLSSFGPPGCSQDGLPALFHPVPCRRQGQEKLVGTTSTLPDAGPGPGLCSRAAMLLAAATALPWGQPAPHRCSPPPPPHRQGPAQLGNSRGIFLHLCWLLAVTRTVAWRLQAVPGGRDALLSFSPSPLQPLPSAYPANGSLTAPSASIFSAPTSYQAHCPESQHGPDRPLALVEPCARVSGLPSGLEYPSFVCSCCCLPASPAPPGKPFSRFRSWPQVSRWSQEQCKEGLGHLNITPPDPPSPITEASGSEAQWTESHHEGSHFISSFRF